MADVLLMLEGSGLFMSGILSLVSQDPPVYPNNQREMCPGAGTVVAAQLFSMEARGAQPHVW